jgi:hypothetical protein
MQQDHAAASMAKLATQLTDQLRDHQMWWTYTAKDQAAAHALVRTQLMELAEANANILAVNTALDKTASSALKTHLLVQSLENKLCERVKFAPSKSAVAHSRRKRNAAEGAEGAEGQGPRKRGLQTVPGTGPCV